MHLSILDIYLDILQLVSLQLVNGKFYTLVYHNGQIKPDKLREVCVVIQNKNLHISGWQAMCYLAKKSVRYIKQLF